MSLDPPRSAGVVAPPSRRPLLLVLLAAAIAAIGGASYFIAGRLAEPASNSVNAAAPATAGQGELLPSGVRIDVIREGTGPRITRADAVLIRYEMRVAGGPVIDGNMDAAEGNGMSLNQTIPGFAEGVMRLRPGGIARFWVPSRLGYGANIPPGAPFGPNDTLEFLVRVERVAPGRAVEIENGTFPGRIDNGVQANDAAPAPRGGR